MKIPVDNCTYHCILDSISMCVCAPLPPFPILIVPPPAACRMKRGSSWRFPPTWSRQGAGGDPVHRGATSTPHIYKYISAAFVKPVNQPPGIISDLNGWFSKNYKRFLACLVAFLRISGIQSPNNNGADGSESFSTAITF